MRHQGGLKNHCGYQLIECQPTEVKYVNTQERTEYYRVQNDNINYIISIVKRITVIKTSKNSHSCLLGEFSEAF